MNPAMARTRGAERETGRVLGGPDIITFLLLALGGALAVGNLAALINPDGPRQRRGGTPPPPGAPQQRPKAGRSVVMIAVGTVMGVGAMARWIGG